jgi:hypothetical protein
METMGQIFSFFHPATGHWPLATVTAALLAWGLMPEDRMPGVPSRIRAALGSEGRNRGDVERRERGYYEQLLDAGGRLDGPTGAIAVPFGDGPLALRVEDVREYVLKPNLATVHEGARWTTNALGMRDRPYGRTKPRDTVRIALLGDSIGAGWGVDDGQGFEPRLERALDGRSRTAGGPAVEVLNFAVPGHAPGQRWETFRRIGWALGIDLVIYEATAADWGWDERRLRALLPRGWGWDSPAYRDALTGAGAPPAGDPETYKQCLRPRRGALLAGSYRAIAEDCRAHGVPSVWVLVPRVGRTIVPAERRRLIELARGAGFSAVLDLSDVYDGMDPEALAIGPDDYHPNADGHARLALRLDAALAGLPEVRRLGLPAAEGQP